MSERNPIRVFVSHLYAPDEAYLRVFEYLESTPNFYYLNVATPEKPPRSKEKEALKEDLRRQIGEAEVVVLVSSLCARDAALVEFQAIYAKASDKPLIVMESFGTGEPLPAKLREWADEVVGWSGRDLTDAIRRQARHEDTTRFDTIEFKLD